MEREKGHVRKQENRGAGDTCHQQSKSKVTQKESRAEQGKTVCERERDSVPSASASARTFIPKSDLVSPTVSLSSLFLQKIPSFLPSFVLLFLCSHRERKGGISIQYCSYHSISSYSPGDSFDWLILVCFACFSLNLLSFNSNPNQTQNQAFSFFVSFEYFLLAQGMNN